MSNGNPHKHVGIVCFGAVRHVVAAALVGALAMAAGCGGDETAVNATVGGSGGTGGSEGGVAGTGGMGGAEAAAGSGGQAGADVSTGGSGGFDASVGGGGTGGQAGADVSTDRIGTDAADAALPDVSLDGAEASIDAQDDCGCSCVTEVCNGVDDNCNGQTDESDPRFGQPCTTTDLGICSVGKFTGCSAGQLVCTSQVEAGTRVEVCNDLDDDCNGVQDDNLNDPRLGIDCAVSGKSGECAKGKTICVTGNVVCGQVFLPGIETCNGKDDDCDGVVDNPAVVTGASCSTGLKGECAAGLTTCGDAGPGCAQVHLPTAESCNGLDDDCNDIIDDVVPDGGAPDGGANTCLTDNPLAVHVRSWGCSSGSSCLIASCDTGWNNVDGQVSNGCECNAKDFTMKSCIPEVILADAADANARARTGIITTQGGVAWFRVDFPTYTVATNNAAGVYRSIEMTNTGDGGYSIAYGVIGTPTECMKPIISCPPHAVDGGTAGGSGPTKWELSVTHMTTCPRGPRCSDLSSIPPSVMVRVTRTQPPACSTFTITTSTRALAGR